MGKFTHQSDNVRIELSLGRARNQDRNRTVKWEARPIRPRRGQCVEAIRHARDSRNEWKLVTADPVWIPRSVRTFVMPPHDGQHGLEGAQGGEEIIANDGVSLYHLAFGRVEGPRLVEDRIGNGDLANVVHDPTLVERS